MATFFPKSKNFLTQLFFYKKKKNTTKKIAKFFGLQLALKKIPWFHQFNALHYQESSYCSYTVDIKGLHTSVKMVGVCDVKNETKLNHVRPFSTCVVKL